MAGVLRYRTIGMRLHPAVSTDEARAWLTARAVEALGAEDGPALQAALTPLAEAMAAVSAVELPDELEPEFP